METMPIQDIIQQAPQAFLPDRAAGVNAVVHFHLTGDQAGDWTITIKDKQCLVAQGVPSNPTLTLTADTKDCVDILTGKMDGVRAFMLGKLKIKGNFNLATRLTRLFKWG
jgi:putative sterol carrier protein